MPWWSWILIWIALIALSLLFYVLMGIRLWRKFMATLTELGAAGDKLGHLPDPGAVPGPATDPPADPAAATQTVPGTAVFASPHQMRHDYHASKSSRVEARRQRRIRRKADRGQPQALHDIEFR
ncbi:hypothetical protein SRABI83_04553 [Arthrobacter sp. Bi83]|uniref:hypothetical protein n=1 Tax=Arthrobacter sp. Bi83 TaxID=2822353 RepID=UPI001DBD3DD3|nr:hypothetical protein [Arthrobacter sp. Bi83]CAH0302035.1 hypothetical protein SRABI83_04553 [Arthrobacter sp. Bi83]